MLRRLGVVVVILLASLPASVAVGQFGTPQPGSEMDSGGGRTPRQPRRSTDADEPVASLPPATPAPGNGETGATPPAPVGVARSHVRSHVETERREIALTLDDGYRPDHRILELIESYGVHGTAFLVGAVADSDPGLVNELARLGWLVCSHTHDHMLLTGRSLETIRSEIRRGIEAVERAVGYRCPYFRAPYGAVDANVVSVTEELGLQLIGWEASISDSAPRGTDPDLQLSIAQRDIRPGSILLGHFGATNSYEVLSRLLAWLGDEGYGVGSVAELIDGNVAPLTAADGTSASGLGTASVTVDLPGERSMRRAMAAPVFAPVTSGADGSLLYVSGVALLLQVSRRRVVPRRRRRVAPERWRDELGQLAVGHLGDTVPDWERPLEPAAATAPDATPPAIVTEGWT
jgi:peptidoglycan/xylan/chitin deacetylase (PgdA/CDA1 family)